MRRIDLDTNPVACIQANATALDAFRKLAIEQLQGMAIVNAKGQIVANISASDLRVWVQPQRLLFGSLYRPTCVCRAALHMDRDSDDNTCRCGDVRAAGRSVPTHRADSDFHRSAPLETRHRHLRQYSRVS